MPVLEDGLSRRTQASQGDSVGTEPKCKNWPIISTHKKSLSLFISKCWHAELDQRKLNASFQMFLAAALKQPKTDETNPVKSKADSLKLISDSLYLDSH